MGEYKGHTDDRELSLRYAGTCTVCGAEIPRGTRAIYSSSTRSVRHLGGCALEQGTAGRSAMREFERRAGKDAVVTQAQRERVRAVFGDGFIGRVVEALAVDDRPRRSTRVWARGAAGEERVAAQLDQLADIGVVALHDRRIPGTRANIDHIAITPWGVWVIDAKRYLGKRPELVKDGAFFGFGGVERLRVGGRLKDDLVSGVERQVERVRSVVGEAGEVRGALCFVDANWPLIGGDFSVRGVEVLWPKRLQRLLLRTSDPTVDVERVSRRLATAFPPA